MSLTIACSRNPLTDALGDPSFDTLGLSIRFDHVPAMKLFASMLTDAPYDVAEFSLANHVMAVASGDRQYVGLPVFSFRGFRHSMLWVKGDAGIERPQDLRGKRIGVDVYASTALAYLRGFLEEDYGVRPDEMTWVRTHPERLAFTPPPGVHLETASRPASLFDLLRAGEVDAIAAFWSPQVDTAGLRRLFADPFAVEANYYRRTGIYPIMHLMVLRRSAYEGDRRLAAVVTRLFESAKQRWRADLATFGAEHAAITPWSPIDFERAREVLGADLYPYGLAPNERTLSAMLRYLESQGLTDRRITLAELFAPEAVDALKAEA